VFKCLPLQLRTQFNPQHSGVLLRKGAPDECVDLLGLDLVQTLHCLLDLLLVSTHVNLMEK
jgi:hypothetical protein